MVLPFSPENLMADKITKGTLTILHTESSLGWGGQERRILLEAKALRNRGHRLLVACDPRGDLYHRARKGNFPVFPLPFGGLGRNLRAWQALRHLLTRERVDILNTHSSLDSWVGMFAWRSLRRRPVLVRTRHLSTPVRKSWPTRWLYHAPAAIITTGENISQVLHERLRVPKSRLFAIPTGVPLEEFAPRPPDLALWESLNFPPNAFIFGTLSVLRSWKGHLFVLEALKRLLEAGKECFLIIVGEGPYRPVIEERLAALGLSEHVRLVGHQEQVADWLALMDVLVMASYAHEGVPQAVLQAMAMGKPVVASQAGGIPEVITPEANGLLVPAKDPDALARAMHRLLQDKGLREDLGRRGKTLVSERFSLEQMATKVETLYAQLLPRSSLAD